MKKINNTWRLARAAFIAIAAFGALSFSSLAQTSSGAGSPSDSGSQSGAGSPTKVVSQTRHIRATVEDIDYTNRQVTLKGPEGNEVEFTVGDEVKNFPQIRKGDVVNISYHESVALALAKPGEPMTPTGSTGVLGTRAPGQRPGGVSMNVTQISATVEDVDRDNREVTLKGPEGKTVQVQVDPSVGDLSRIKKGDRINARITQALAISVDKPGTGSDSNNPEQK